jgi:hypothetical protein
MTFEIFKRFLLVERLTSFTVTNSSEKVNSMVIMKHYYFHTIPGLIGSYGFQLSFLTFVVDVVASVTLNYQLIQNSLKFENLIFFFKNSKK